MHARQSKNPTTAAAVPLHPAFFAAPHYRLELDQIRTFEESLVRNEFAYVAENLLLRGGYRKSHFQADQTTLQSVSQMGALTETRTVRSEPSSRATFDLAFSRNKELRVPSEVMAFTETILQAAMRKYLASPGNLTSLLTELGVHAISGTELEILGEKALPQGHVDILLKKRVPLGADVKIPIEVKMKKAGPKDLAQLLSYMGELRRECPTGILIATEFHKKLITTARESNVKLVRYSLGDRGELREGATFDQLLDSLALQPLVL